MKRIFLLLLITLLCGCVAPNAAERMSFIESMNKWIGRSADDLVATNGAPANIYQLESGGREFEYVRVLKLTEAEAEFLHMRAGRVNVNHLYVPDTRTPSTTRSTGLSKYVLGAGVTCKLLFDVTAGNIINSWNVDEGTCY